jgi:hypothetical protein
MIRQPDFVTDAVVEQAKLLVAKKKGLDATKARFEIFTEGLCAQILHLGSYDDEPATIFTLDEFIAEQGYQTEMSGWRQHHEIYLSDPRRTEPEKLKTIIRHPIVAL